MIAVVCRNRKMIILEGGNSQDVVVKLNILGLCCTILWSATLFAAAVYTLANECDFFNAWDVASVGIGTVVEGGMELSVTMTGADIAGNVVGGKWRVRGGGIFC